MKFYQSIKHTLLYPLTIGDLVLLVEDLLHQNQFYASLLPVSATTIIKSILIEFFYFNNQ